MNRLRLRPGFGLLVASVVAAALLVGGCATPEDEEDARFGSIVGAVVDVNGNPIPGARVTVIDRAGAGAIGTLNFFGDRGPFVTDSRGRFFIEGITVQPNDTAVLNLRVEKEGFIPSIASKTVTQTITVAGRTIPAGTQTPDIVVNQEIVSEVVAVLQGIGSVTQLGSSGGTITVGVPNPLGGSLGNATVTIPAGALAQPTTISVTPLVGSALPGGAAIVAGSPSQVLGPGQTVIAQTPLAAVDLEPDGLTFPAGSLPTITLPIPLTLPAGTIIPILRFDPATGVWNFETNATVQPGGTTIAFQVTRFSTRIAAITTTWSAGALSGVLESVFFPPIETFPEGYIAITRIFNSLVFPGAPADQAAFLANSFESLAKQRANGPVPVVVPAGTQFGVRCDRHSFPVTVTFTLPGAGAVSQTGTRTVWLCTTVPLAPVPTVPVHLQGHVQGGATGG